MRAGTAFVTLAALCWGLAGGIGSLLMAAGWDAFVVSFYRGVIGLLVALVWLLLYRRNSGLGNHRLWFWATIAGLGVTGNFAFYFVSIAQGSIAVAATLMYSAPVFVYLVSFALRLERATARKYAAIVLVILGIVLLTHVYDIGASAITPLGVGSGLLAGISYAIFIFGFKNATRHGSPAAILSIAFTVLAAILLWASDFDQIVAVPKAQSWPLFVGLGVLGAGLSFALYVIGLRRTAPAVASIVAMVEPVTAALFGFVILNERLAGQQIVGMGLILVTVTALSIASSNGRTTSDYPQ